MFVTIGIDRAICMSDATTIAGFGVKGLILGLASLFVAPQLTATIVAIKLGDQIARGVSDNRDRVSPQQPKNQQDSFQQQQRPTIPPMSPIYLGDNEQQQQ